MEGDDVDFTPDFASCSVESLLNVPMPVIFRETRTADRGRGGNGGGGQKNFLLSKSEVSTLLRVSMLSSELDAILSLASDALDRSQKCKAYRKIIEESNKDTASANAGGYLLRAMLPILHVHSETAERALEHATCETFGISRVLNQLEACANDLSKFGEQNHNMADQLECYMPPGETNLLSNEKRAIAEMEEAIVERIESLNVLATGGASSGVAARKGDASAANAFGGGAEGFVSMSDLCESLFSKYQLSSNIPRPDARGQLSSNIPRPDARGQVTESQQDAAATLQFMRGK